MSFATYAAALAILGALILFGCIFAAAAAPREDPRERAWRQSQRAPRDNPLK